MLELFGASTTLLTALVFPVLFYLYLTASGRMRDEQVALTLKEKPSESDTPIEYPKVNFKEMIKNNKRYVVIIGFGVM